MKVFCPNCGQANETGPGTRVMCTACTAVFEAPAQPSGFAPAQQQGPAPLAPPPPAANPQWGGQFQQPQANPYQQPAPYNSGQIYSGSQGNHTLAIVSLVCG